MEDEPGPSMIRHTVRVVIFPMSMPNVENILKQKIHEIFFYAKDGFVFFPGISISIFFHGSITGGSDINIFL